MGFFFFFPFSFLQRLSRGRPCRLIWSPFHRGQEVRDVI
uniref:Uncharacterized protein n=1 Tax=Anguilla anguilla TaxID=7936 RepID=A0A0E9PW10_ANGAN